VISLLGEEVAVRRPGATSLVATVPVERCPLCGAGGSWPFARVQDLGAELRYRLCGCGLVYLAARYAAADLARFYAEEYRVLYTGSAEPTEPDQAKQRARAAHLAAFLGERVDPVRSHLDVGCSTGALLRAVRERWPGARVAGVELSDAHRAFCAAHGLAVHPSLEALAASGAGRFQVVSLSHVLEHLPDPVGELRRLRDEVLEPDGRLLLEVPNLFGHRSFELTHLVCFTPKTLADAVRAAGFRVEALKVHGVPRDRWGRTQYVTLLARPAEAPAPPPRRVSPLAVRLLRLATHGRRDLELKAMKLPRRVVRRLRRLAGLEGG
jgi:SAM-dependent methyltransferase